MERGVQQNNGCIGWKFDKFGPKCGVTQNQNKLHGIFGSLPFVALSVGQHVDEFILDITSIRDEQSRGTDGGDN